MDLPAVLAAVADGPVSGAALADRFGVTRSMVWKAVEALRAEGLGISGGRNGYTLDDPAGFGPATLAWRTDAWRTGRQVAFHPSCGSTNVLARNAARAWSGPPSPGPIVVADHQTEGRGRRGRTWQSRPGENLLFSLVLRPPVAPTLAARCVLQWAAAMAEALDLRVKWPNDLVTEDGDKVAGVLAALDVAAEPFGAGATVRHVIVGVGINVNQRDFGDDLPGATSLAARAGRSLDRAALLGRLVAAIETTELSGPDPLGPWRARSHTLGRRVRIGEIEGVANAIREDGALLVGGHPVLTGDVELLAD